MPVSDGSSSPDSTRSLLETAVRHLDASAATGSIGSVEILDALLSDDYDARLSDVLAQYAVARRAQV